VYLNIQINQINDHLKNARDVKDIGHYSSGKTEITILDRSELPYTLSLIKQAYQKLNYSYLSGIHIITNNQV
jgi:predicted transport protein